MGAWTTVGGFWCLQFTFIYMQPFNTKSSFKVWESIYKSHRLAEKLRERQKVLAESSIVDTERNNGDGLNHYRIAREHVTAERRNQEDP